MHPIHAILERIGATSDLVELFEVDKYLIRSSGRPGTGPQYFVKRPRELDPPSRLAVGAIAECAQRPSAADLNRELNVLEAVALLPIEHDPDSGYLSYRYCQDTTPLKVMIQSGESDKHALLALTGSALATFHRAAGALLAETEVKQSDIHDLWPDLLQPSPAQYARGAGADYPLAIRYLQSFEGYRDGAEIFRKKEYSPAICHGDFKFDNVLVHHENQNIRIIDFNDLIKYDLDFDLGTACAEIISVWLFGIDYKDVDGIEAAIEQAEEQFDVCQTHISTFLAGYCGAAPDRALAKERCAYFAGRSLINVAIGSLHLTNYLSRYHWACLHVGANLVANAEEFGALFTQGAPIDA